MTPEKPHLSPALPPCSMAADEPTTLAEMLDYFRAVLARKGSGLSDAQLAKPLAPSDLTIGGLIYHMAYVEDFWFVERFLGKDAPEPWLSIDWDADPDWELHNAHRLSSAELFAQYDRSVARSREIFEAADSLDQLSATSRPTGETENLRWIMVHMIEEYARHCGHADFIRQSIDGVVDD